MAEKFNGGHVDTMLAAAQTMYANFVIGIFDGTQPTNAADSEGSANLLCLITFNGGAFTAGVATNGLNFDTPSAGVMSKPAGAVWKGVGLAAAGTGGTTATWFRVYSNAYVTGADDVNPRWDGAIGTTSSYELQMTNPVVVQDVETTLSAFNLNLPKSA